MKIDITVISTRPRLYTGYGTEIARRVVACILFVVLSDKLRSIIHKAYTRSLVPPPTPLLGRLLTSHQKTK